MDYIAVSFYIWGTVTLVSAIIAFLCYRWLSNVARFDSSGKLQFPNGAKIWVS